MTLFTQMRLRCNFCGDWSRQAWATEKEVAESLVRSGWKSKDGEDICPKCINQKPRFQLKAGWL